MLFLYHVTLPLQFLKFNPYKPGIRLWDIGNRIAPDVTPQNAASHLGLFCLLTAISSKNEIKMKKILLVPLKMKVDSSK